jgi:hypothetical protein
MQEEGVRKPVGIPLKYFKALEESRIVFWPYPGLMLVDAAMLDRVKTMLADKQFAEHFDVVIVPKMGAGKPGF